MSNKGKLFLIPNLISENTENEVLSPRLISVLPGIHHFLAEDIRTARRYLSLLKIYPSIESLHFSVLDKNTRASEIFDLFSPILQGADMGVISESGCPGVADPGALAVEFAHKNGIQVVPMVGPSSILLALMASGLNGQRFSFQGYLPIEGKEGARVIREFEKESQVKNQTQIFIETPYRNNSLFQNLLKSLHEDTRLCLAVDLSGQAENITTRSVKEWKKQPIELPKKPTVFLFLALV
jgi:16S rRNA (cytidine1402-2'-O)-methyltransferase